jgi:uncharacterized delta-60 repeat protein
MVLTAAATVATVAVVSGCTQSIARDPDYGAGGLAELDPVLYLLDRNAFEVAPDGSVVLAATGGGAVSIVRVGPDGQADDDFAANVPSPPSSIDAVALDAQGRILTAEDTEGSVTVHRLLPEGGPDPAFGGGDGVVTLANQGEGGTVDVQVDHTGRIAVLFERTSAPAPNGRCTVARLLADGSTDATFAGGTPVSLAMPYAPGIGAQCHELVVPGDDSLLVADLHAGIARLDPSGAVDAAYGDGARTFTGGRDLVDVALLPDDRLALGTVGGDLNSTQLKVGRLLPDGELDPSFGTGGVDLASFHDLDPLWSPRTGGRFDHIRFRWLAPTPDGDLVAVGGITAEGFGIARWSDGRLDTSFATGGRHVITDEDLAGPNVLDSPVAGAVAPDGGIYAVSNRQGALAPLTMVRLLLDPPPG